MPKYTTFAAKYILIFGVKCAYMFYVRLAEYRKCKSELDNDYDENPDMAG